MAKKRVLVLCAYLRCDRAQGLFREFLQPMSALHVAAFVGHDKYDVRLHYEMYHGPFCSANAGQYDIVLSGDEACVVLYQSEAAGVFRAPRTLP